MSRPAWRSAESSAEFQGDTHSRSRSPTVLGTNRALRAIMLAIPARTLAQKSFYDNAERASLL